MNENLVRELLAGGPAKPSLVACAGFEPAATPAPDVQLPDSRLLIDLDELESDAALPETTFAAVLVLARTATDLRRVAAWASALPEAKRVVIAVAYGRSGTPPPVPFPPTAPAAWGSYHDVRVRRRKGGGWSVDARLGRWLPAGQFLAAVVRALGGSVFQTMQRPVSGLAGHGFTHWRPADANAVVAPVTGPIPNHASMPAADLVLRSLPGPAPAWRDGRVRAVDRLDLDAASWARLGGRGGNAQAHAVLPLLSGPEVVPPVDERSVNPTGFLSYPRAGMGLLTVRGSGWVVTTDDQADGTAVPLVRFHPSGCVTDVDVAKLRQLRGLRIGRGWHTGPITAARVLAGLAAAGVPILASRVPPWLARLLGVELGRLITTARLRDLTDDLRREEYSIRLRRAALRTHGAYARWAGIATEVGLSVPRPPKVSVLLPTRRPQLLAFALNQIARQRHVDLEVVVGLHGVSADLPEVRDAAQSFDRPLTVVEIPESMPLGAGLNELAARATGHYIAKMDDDDWYGPEYLADLMLALSYSGADLTGCPMEFAYLEQIALTIRLRIGGERPDRQVAGTSFFMKRALFDEVGGFRPMTVGADTQFLRLVLAVGGRIYRSHGLGLLVRRMPVNSHTWNEPIGYFLRLARSQWRGFRPSAILETAEPGMPVTKLPLQSVSEGR